MSILAIAVVVILFLFLLAAFCSSLLYWYETINSPCPEVPSPRPGPLNCLQVFLYSLGGYVIGVCLHPVGWFWKIRPGAVKALDPAKPPLVLIHGLNDNASSWLYLAQRLRKEGYTVSTFSYLSLFNTITTVCSRLEEHIFQVETLQTEARPLLVGHSLGGILIRRWLQTPGNDQRISGVLTLATPHGGSKVAALAPGRLAREITPAASLIQELQASAGALDVPCVSLVTPTDDAVLPASSLLPPQGWRMRVTHRISHFGMLFCPRIARILLEEITVLYKNIPKERRSY